MCLQVHHGYLSMVAGKQLCPSLRGRTSTDDVVQETMLLAWRHRAQFRGTTEVELTAWLRRILMNHIAHLHRDHRTTAKRRLSREVGFTDLPSDAIVDLPREQASPSRQLMAAEVDQALHHALDQLPERYRTVIRWRNLDLLSFRQIGDRLGLSENAARKLWSRALQQLQAMLEPCRGE